MYVSDPMTDAWKTACALSNWSSTGVPSRISPAIFLSSRRYAHTSWRAVRSELCCLVQEEIVDVRALRMIHVPTIITTSVLDTCCSKSGYAFDTETWFFWTPYSCERQSQIMMSLADHVCQEAVCSAEPLSCWLNRREACQSHHRVARKDPDLIPQAYVSAFAQCRWLFRVTQSSSGLSVSHHRAARKDPVLIPQAYVSVFARCRWLFCVMWKWHGVLCDWWLCRFVLRYGDWRLRSGADHFALRKWWRSRVLWAASRSRIFKDTQLSRTRIKICRVRLWCPMSSHSIESDWMECTRSSAQREHSVIARISDKLCPREFTTVSRKQGSWQALRSSMSAERHVLSDTLGCGRGLCIFSLLQLRVSSEWGPSHCR